MEAVLNLQWLKAASIARAYCWVTLPLVTLALSGCAEIQTLGASAIQHRQVMNDLQTRASIHALCDISVGSYFRELRVYEQHFVAGICSGGEIEQLEAGE